MKPTNQEIIEKALDLGFKVTYEYTRHLRKERVRVSVFRDNDECELLSGSSDSPEGAVRNLYGMCRSVEESLQRAFREADELCFRVAEAAEDFCILNRNIEGKRRLFAMTTDDDNGGSFLIAGWELCGASARVEVNDEVLAQASSPSLQEAIRECKLQLQGTRDALDALYTFVSGVTP